jgi:hypothetical protein
MRFYKLQVAQKNLESKITWPFYQLRIGSKVQTGLHYLGIVGFALSIRLCENAVCSAPKWYNIGKDLHKAGIQ